MARRYLLTLADPAAVTALAGDVARELRWGVFERGGDCTQDLLHRQVDRLTDLPAVHLYLRR